MPKMKTATLTAPETIVFGEAEIPAPQPGEVLIKVERIGVCGSDPTIYFGKHPYVTYPVIMGHEISGTVCETGEGVASPVKGDEVTVIPHLVCGYCKPCREKIYNFCEELRCIGAEADGAYRGYITMQAEMVLPIPGGMSLDDAAMVEPASVSYHAAKRGEITANDTALIIGAGPIGNFCMQGVKALGAKQVVIADVDAGRLGLAMAHGADGAIDVSVETLEEGLSRLCGGHRKVDVFYDCVGGNGGVFNDILRIARRGTRVVIVGVLQNAFDVPLLPDFVQHELRLSGTTMYTPADYKETLRLMGAGNIRTDGMITHYFDFDQVIDVYKAIANREFKFFKIMLKV